MSNVHSTKKKTKKPKKKGGSHIKKNSLFKSKASKHGKIFSNDKVASDLVDLDNDVVGKERKTWDLGKQLGIYGHNEEEIIAALVKCGIAKGINSEQGNIKIGRARKKSRSKLRHRLIDGFLMTLRF